MPHERQIRLIYRASQLCISMTLASCAVLVGVCAAIAQDATGVGAVLDVSAKLADAAARDVTRLALQVAIASIIVNALLIGATFRLAFAWGRKPCIMEAGAGIAVLREAIRAAHEKE